MNFPNPLTVPDGVTSVDLTALVNRLIFIHRHSLGTCNCAVGAVMNGWNRTESQRINSVRPRPRNQKTKIAKFFRPSLTTYTLSETSRRTRQLSEFGERVIAPYYIIIHGIPNIVINTFNYFLQYNDWRVYEDLQPEVLDPNVLKSAYPKP